MSEPMPQNLDAEESVLGAMMLSPLAIGAVLERSPLRPGDFYRQSHGVIYQAIVDVYARGEGADAITVVAELERTGQLKAAQGAERVHELAALVPAASNAAHYARIVRDTARRRGLIAAGNEIAKLGWDGEGDPAKLADRAESLLFDATGSTETGKPLPLVDLLRDGYRKLKALYEQGETITGVPTGFDELDRMTTGLQPGNLIVIAARPSMGKSALAMNIVENAALHHGRRSLAFMLEMSREEVTQRVISSEARVESDRLRTGRLTNDDWQKVAEACQRLAGLPVHIDDTGTTTVAEIRSKARRMKMQHPDLAMIVVDYLQLIDKDLRKGETETQAVGRISRALKMLARDLNVPVVALAQLSRKVEERGDKRPMLSDLRDSGAIEQDADVVVFLYRDDYYNQNSDAKGIAEAIVAKQRNGPTGTVKLAFVRRYSKFQPVRS